MLEGVTEWLKVADCKSVGCSHRRFKSYSLQIIDLDQPFEI